MTVEQRKNQLKEYRAWLILASVLLITLGICEYGEQLRTPAGEGMIESTEDVLRFDMGEVEVEPEEIIVEPATEEILVNGAGIKLYDVPLAEELQIHTFYECDGHSMAPAIPIAIMDVESAFTVDIVSVNGAIGIMQIAPVWHQERMDRLGCTDLFDPYQNITVGIDYLAELIDMNPDTIWVLTAYRYGPDKADEKINNGDIDYALAVLERASELEAEYERLQSMAK